MAATALKTKIISIKEYLAFEETSQVRHEFYNGKIIEMPGGSPTHSRLIGRMSHVLISVLEKKDKELVVYTADLKIGIPNANTIVYPDVLVVCEKVELMKGRKDVVINPLLVVEILSPSTEHHDRNDKFMLYKQIPSLKEYVLVKQERPHINTFFRDKPNTWIDTVEENLEKFIYFASIDCEISLAQVYKGIF